MVMHHGPPPMHYGHPQAPPPMAEADEMWIEDLADWTAVCAQWRCDALKLTPFLEVVVVNDRLPMKCVYAPKAVFVDNPFRIDYPPQAQPPPQPQPVRPPPM